MGLVSGISKVAKAAYCFVRYGKQVGKTAKNGSKVFKRSGILTGVSKDGKLLGQVKMVKTGTNQVTHYTKHPIPYTDRFKMTELRIMQNRDDIHYFKANRTASLDLRKGDVDWVSLTKQRKSGKISGNGQYNDENFAKYYKNFTA